MVGSLLSPADREPGVQDLSGASLPAHVVGCSMLIFHVLFYMPAWTLPQTVCS